MKKWGNIALVKFVLNWTRYFTRCLVSCLAVCTLFANTSVAAEQELMQQQIYRVGVEDIDYYPMYSDKSALDNPGFLIDVLEIFAKQHNIKFEYIHLPTTRFHEWYQKENIDFRLPDHSLWNSGNEGLVFSEDIINLRADTVVLKENRKLPESEIRTIGTLYGFIPGPQWASRIEENNIEFVYEGSTRILIRMLKKGLIDGLDLNIHVVKHYATELDYDANDFALAKHAPSTQFSYQLSTTSHPDIIRQFDAFLENAKNEIAALKRANNIYN